MTHERVLAKEPGAPRGAPPRRRLMRVRLFVILALATAAVVALVAGLEPGKERGRSVEPARPSPAAAEEPRAAVPAVPVPALRVSVRDERDNPLSGARCQVDAWKAAAETLDDGFARIPVRAGVPTEFSVRASKDGYRPAARHGRFVADGVVQIRLLKAPQIRVFNGAGERVTDFSSEPPGADLRERTLRARGYLTLDLKELPAEMLGAWDDLLATKPVDLFLVSDAGLPCAALRVVSPDGAAVGIDTTGSALPDLSPRLVGLPPGWREFYASRWPALRGPRALLGVKAGEEIRVYAERTLVVSCLAADCRPLREEIEVPPGRTVERTLELVRETWADQELVVTDRYGRQGRVDVALLGPVRFPLGSFETQASTVRVPRGGGPYRLEVDGGARGRAVQTLETLPAGKPIRFELKGVEVHLKLVDEETGDAVEGIDLHVEGEADLPVRWIPDEGAYVLGPVDPGTIAVVHGTECRVDVRVDASEAEKGVLRRELRVRGFPKSAPPEPE